MNFNKFKIKLRKRLESKTKNLDNPKNNYEKHRKYAEEHPEENKKFGK